jgi:hypothetical protein
MFSSSRRIPPYRHMAEKETGTFEVDGAMKERDGRVRPGLGLGI